MSNRHLTSCTLLLALNFSWMCLAETPVIMPSPKAPAQNRPESPSSVSPIVDVKVRVHDFSKAIEAHVQSSPLAPEVARKNAIAQLLAVPNHHDSLLKSKEIAPGKFQVVATNHTHQYLDGIAEWMAKGEKQIVVETRMVTVSESELKQLHRQFRKRWKMSATEQETVFPGGSDNPAANPVSFASFNTLSKSAKTRFSSMRGTNVALPCRIARLSTGETQQWLSQQQGNATSNLLQAPKVTMFPGQFATVKDAAQHPFVVSVKPINEGDATAMQPIIKVLEEGLSIDLCCNIDDDDHLLIDSGVTFSRIGKVDTFTFESEDAESGTTIQIPEHLVKKVQLSSKIESGETLLIDPHFFTTKSTKRRFRSDLVTRDFTIVLLTAKIIDTSSHFKQD